MRAIRCDRFGGPEVLTPADVPDPVPGPGQVLVEVGAAGVNFADTSRIAGSYRPAPELPFVPGTEVVGRTADGRRVLASAFGGGGFAERAVVEEADAVEVPSGVGDGEALALLVQGLTAWHVLAGCARIRPGESVVVNAVAVAGDADGYAERVRAANHGDPVDIVLDSVGGGVFSAGLDALATFGRLVSFGNASREGRPPVDPGELADRCTAVMGFWLRPAIRVPGAYREPLAEMFTLVAAGSLRPLAAAAYPLDQARRAFEDLLARRTVGKISLRP